MIINELIKPLTRVKFDEFKRKLSLMNSFQNKRLKKFSLRGSVRKQANFIYDKNRKHGSWTTDLIPRVIPIRINVIELR